MIFCICCAVGCLATGATCLSSYTHIIARNAYQTVPLFLPVAFSLKLSNLRLLTLKRYLSFRRIKTLYSGKAFILKYYNTFNKSSTSLNEYAIHVLGNMHSVVFKALAASLCENLNSQIKTSYCLYHNDNVQYCVLYVLLLFFKKEFPAAGAEY